MRESLNFDMLPIVDDNMNGVFNAGIVNISSNGYYGYQAHLDNKEKPKIESHESMDFQCTNATENSQNMHCDMQNNVLRLVNRKRAWEYNELHDVKKRRQNEPVPLLPLQTPPPLITQNSLHLRKPTHNVPDIPRCVMSHYV